MQDWTNVLAAVRVGGWVIYPLTVLAVLAVAIVLDRAYVFLRFGQLAARHSGRTRYSQGWHQPFS